MNALKTLHTRASFRAVLAMLLILALGFIFSGEGAFHRWDTHRDMFRQIAEFGILACGLTVVIISGGIDLSVGSILGLIAVIFALITIHHGIPVYAAIPMCLLAGGALGGISGFLIHYFRMQPFVVTLAMMVFARGAAKYVSGGQKISNYVMKPDSTFEIIELPKVFDVLNSQILGGNLAVVTVIYLCTLVVTAVILATTPIGRYLYAVGGNEDSARLSGVPVGLTKLFAYALCGVFAAMAGICHAAQERQGDPEAGATYELTAIAIVVIGGTNLMGGRGGALLTLLGSLTIGYLDKILSINAVSEAGRLMLTGLIIVSAVIFQRRRT